MAGDQGHGRCGLGVRHGQLGVGGHGQSGGRPGDDLQRHAGGAQGGDFFGQAAKDAWVAGLEADDGFALPGGGDHLRVDLLLRDVPARAVMAQADQFGPGPGVRERRRIDQVVVEDQVGAAETFGGAEREKPGIAGSGAGEIDPAEIGCFAVHRPIPRKPPLASVSARRRSIRAIVFFKSPAAM